MNQFFEGGDVHKWLNGLEPISSATLAPTGLGGWTVGAQSGTHFSVDVGNMAAGDLFGVSGLSTCVGVIARERIGPQSRMFAVHFGSTENPYPTLNEHSDMFKPGNLVIVVFDKDTVDPALLQVILKKLRNDFKITPKIFMHWELFLDQNMQPYCRTAQE